MTATNLLPAPTAETYDWQRHAACRGRDSAVFFQPDGERGQARQHREHQAKQVCAVCPVQTACLAHAISAGEPYGIWGGLTPAERGQFPTQRPEPASTAR